MSDVEHAVKLSEFAPGQSRSDTATTGVRRSLPGSGTKGFLGVIVGSFAPGRTMGVSVGGTFAGSAAARVGLAAGDTITSVGGTGLTSAASLRERISASESGEHVNVVWITPQGTGHVASARLSREPATIRLRSVTLRAA